MAFDFAAPAARLLRTALVPAALAASLAAVPVLAQAQETLPEASEATTAAPAPIAPQTVLATVGGQDITEGDLAFAAEDLAAELQSIPPEQRRAFLLTVLIDMKVMANAARDEGLDTSEDFARRLAYLEDRALRREYFADVIEASVTDEAIAAFYDEVLTEYTPQPEVRARHIVVETREEAESIRAEIEGGLSFEEAAGQYGTDATRETGGDLGYFSAGMMVPPFEEAVFALDEGQLSQPVETQFGWHLILLEDRRLSEAPGLDAVRPQIAQQVLYENFETTIGALKSDTEIVIEDAELATQVEAQGGI